MPRIVSVILPAPLLILSVHIIEVVFGGTATATGTGSVGPLRLWKQCGDGDRACCSECALSANVVINTLSQWRRAHGSVATAHVLETARTLR